MSEHITHTPSIKRLERSSDRVLAGVAGGLGRYFDLSPMFFRLGFVVLTLLGGVGILVYLAALLVIPEEGKQDSIAADVLAQRRERPWALVGLGLAAAALAVLLSRAILWPAAGAGWAIVLVAGLAILWTSRGARRARRLLVVVAVLAALALAAIVTAVTLAFTWFDVGLGDGTGDRVAAPATAAALKPSYKLGVGDLRVDLSSLRALPHTRHVRASVGVGELRIVVPRTLRVAVDAHAKVGDVYVFDRHDDGSDVSVQTGGRARLVIDARVGLGRIDVVRAVR